MACIHDVGPLGTRITLLEDIFVMIQILSMARVMNSNACDFLVEVEEVKVDEKKLDVKLLNFLKHYC